MDWQRKKIEMYRTGLEKKIIELTQKSEAMEAIKMELLPILEKNLARLQQTVASDLPYNIDERKRSLGHADLVVNDYDAGPLEKTRSVLDAMAREVDLGHTVGVLEAGVEVDNEQRRAKALQLGRISLFSVTMDGHTAYRWDLADFTIILPG